MGITNPKLPGCVILFLAVLAGCQCTEKASEESYCPDNADPATGAKLLQVAAQRSGPAAWLAGVLAADAAEDGSVEPTVHFAPPELQVLTAATAATTAEEELPIIPKPLSVKRLSGESLALGCLFVEATSEYPDPDASSLLQTAAWIYSESKSIPLQLSGACSQGLPLRLHKLDSFASLDTSTKEGYEVVTAADGVDIYAASDAGLFYGLMTLRQLLCSASADGAQEDLQPLWRLPAVEIHDAPALEWRGIMLDVSRHFFTAAEVKQLLTTMALFKLNRFHWHLTDDQGWRFPVESWPELVKMGATRWGTPRNQSESENRKHDKREYKGHYKASDLHDVVQHAAALFIDVVPEVDMPGHAEAAISAYQDLGNTDIPRYVPAHVATRFGPQEYTLAPKNLSFQFIRDIVDEEAKYFPSQYLHLGGDEVLPKFWDRSPFARQFAESHGLAKIGLLQAVFQNVGVERAAYHSKRSVVWEEAADPGKNLSEEAVVMLWKVDHNQTAQDFSNSVKGLTQRGYDVVLTPAVYTYLDFAESDAGLYQNPMDFGTTPLNQTYAMPIITAPGDSKGRVLGAQAQLWTEFITTKAHLDYMAWPRGIALAERFWVGGESGDFHLFKSRLAQRLPELGLMGVNYRPLATST